MNTKNLKILSEFLKTVPTLQDSGELKARFTMHYYSGLVEKEMEQVTCGSAGCAIGFAPFAGIKKQRFENWTSFSERVFGLWSASPEWNWCFSNSWTYTDNTPEGAAARIEWLLVRGLPENWREQLFGKSKLCYK